MVEPTKKDLNPLLKREKFAVSLRKAKKEEIIKKKRAKLSENTEEQIEEWIVEWYRSEFNEVGCDGSVAQSRMPPSWLAVWRRDEEA